MPIAAMDDTHLLNTLNLFVRRLKAYIETAKVGNGLDEVQRAVYDVERVNPQDVAQRIRYFLTVASPYILELYIRGDMSFRDELCELIQREGRLETGLNQLESGERNDHPF